MCDFVILVFGNTKENQHYICIYVCMYVYIGTAKFILELPDSGGVLPMYNFNFGTVLTT